MGISPRESIFEHPQEFSYYRATSDSTLRHGEYIAEDLATAWYYMRWGASMIIGIDIEGEILDLTGDPEEEIDWLEENLGISIDRSEVGFVADALEYPGVAEALTDKNYVLISFTEIEPYGKITYKYLGTDINGTIVLDEYLDWDAMIERFGPM